MSDARFDIVFRGDIVPGQVLPQVKQRLAALFKRSVEQIEPLFSGSPVALKKELDQASAEKYKKVLEQAGALVEIRAAGTLKTPVARPKPALKTEIEKAVEKKSAVAEPAQSGSDTNLGPTYTLSLAPAEGYLLSDQERKQLETPVAHVPDPSFDLRPLEGTLVDDNEIERLAPVDVAEVAFDLSEVGVELIDAEYREAAVLAKVAELAADLAPPGSDLGQIKKEPSPPPPDTSKLSLVD